MKSIAIIVIKDLQKKQRKIPEVRRKVPGYFWAAASVVQWLNHPPFHL